tara:strand:+ start:2370 stop:2888 length:519 start_codon:yes stop_codon:yes gene_type:complete
MEVKILEEVFDTNFQNELYGACRNASYNIGWNDTGDIELSNRPFFHSMGDLNAPIVKDTDLKIKSELLKEELMGFELSKTVINCSRPGETYWEHTHNNSRVVLYYPNFKWNREWGGESLFYDSKGKDLIFASEYKPNRMILFNGEIPHSVRAPTYIADQYRFTMSFFYKLKQ